MLYLRVVEAAAILFDFEGSLAKLVARRYES